MANRLLFKLPFTPWSLRYRTLNHQPDIIGLPIPEQGQLFGKTTTGDQGKLPAPIASVAVGTAALRRTWKWWSAMIAAGCADRVQSLTVYDCNQTNIDDWLAHEDAYTKSVSILPSYLPHPEGFLRRIHAFQALCGRIERDLEHMARTMMTKANEAGAYPQVILEWIGFGGHAFISYLFHEIIADYFPDAAFLPIYCIPDERPLEKNMRDEVWAITQEVHSDRLAIITDNAVTSSVEQLDTRLAIALTAIEAAYRVNTDAVTLTEVASMFGLNRSRWLGVAERQIPLRVEDDALVLGKDASAIHGVKQAIWDIAQPHLGKEALANCSPPSPEDEQHIVVTLPVTREHLLPIRQDIADQLTREQFAGAYPGTKVAYAPANFGWSHEQGITHAHVCKIFVNGPGQPPSLQRILNPNYRTEPIRRRSIPSPGAILVQSRSADHRHH